MQEQAGSGQSWHARHGVSADEQIVERRGSPGTAILLANYTLDKFADGVLMRRLNLILRGIVLLQNLDGCMESISMQARWKMDAAKDWLHLRRLMRRV